MGVIIEGRDLLGNTEEIQIKGVLPSASLSKDADGMVTQARHQVLSYLQDIGSIVRSYLLHNMATGSLDRTVGQVDVMVNPA